MTQKLLYIEASPAKETSFSSRIANVFLDAYKEAHPDHEVEHLPLFEVDLPDFGYQGVHQKLENLADMFSGGSGIEVKGDWAGVAQEIERLKSADKVLLSAPMWNWSIPYKLKHWIDLVTQVGITIKVSPPEYEYVGQITGRPLQMVLASGSPYEMRFPQEGDGLKTDFQRAYLDHIFRALGFTDIDLIKAQPCGLPGPELDEMIARCEERARKAAVSF